MDSNPKELAKGRTVKISWKGGPTPTEQEVTDYFSYYGTIVQIKLKERAGLVLFSEASDANNAVASVPTGDERPPVPKEHWQISQFAASLSPNSPVSSC